ncbi:hypothetical protein OPT61_g4628 [Boeremia exigua]|uniref:Uncharacterized protein n=1 Tax=Boeremia exigua TaxID=749465 RepID=A0ACC2ID77_9PLEO|nr:hypothetical protein OPT61_g4628 [Boeremia exigua]
MARIIDRALDDFAYLANDITAAVLASGSDKLACWPGLHEHCQVKKLGEIMYQDISDRRGGRTAWSTIAVVNGMHYQARFWYDGTRMDQAREDAAEIALRQLTGYIDPKSQPPPASQYGHALAA